MVKWSKIKNRVKSKPHPYQPIQTNKERIKSHTVTIFSKNGFKDQLTIVLVVGN